MKEKERESKEIEREADVCSAERDAVYKCIYNRRDVRGQFLPNPIPDQVLARLLNAAHRAPSVGFMQPWDFIVVRDGAIKQRVAWGAKGHLRQFVEGFIGTSSMMMRRTTSIWKSCSAMSAC